MKCPYCSSEFELTWKRYFSAFTGKHKCPNCNQIGKLKYKSILKRFLYLFVLVLVVVVLHFFVDRVLELSYGPVIGFLLSLAFLFPLDKLHDQ